MPQYLEIRNQTSLALRQVDEAMNVDDSSGDGELAALKPDKPDVKARD